MAVPIDRQIVSPLLVGRTAALESLVWLIDQSRAGTGHTVLLSGEAGIGKSRLIAEIKNHAARQGFSVVQANCFEPDRSLPFAPLLDLLRTVNTNYSDDVVTRVLGPNARILGKLLPEWAVRWPESNQPTDPSPEMEKRRLFDALVQLIGFLAAHGSTLLIFEDIHWSDDTSLEFLLYLAGNLAARPIALLFTYRSEEAAGPLSHFLAEVDRERLAAELQLTRLSLPEVDLMLRAILNRRAPLPQDFLQTIHALTEGNPFFIEEVLQSLIVAGEIPPSGDSWAESTGNTRPASELRIPRSIQDAVRQRSTRVSATARDVLALAAVAGRRFDFGLLQTLTRHDDQELLRLMKELIAAQLVVEESADQFAFRHALTREAVYADMLARERKMLHQAVGQAMETIYAGALDPHLADLSTHFWHAGAWAKALEYAERAGTQAQSLYALRVAAVQFSRAIDAARHLSLKYPLKLFRARGIAYDMLGEIELARADYEAVLSAARIDQDDQLEWQALLDLGLLWAGRDYTKTGLYYRQAFELAHTLDDPTALAHSLNRMGNWYLNVDQPVEARRYHEKALQIFQDVNDTRGIAETLDFLGVSMYMSGDLIQGTACYERAVALFRQLDNRQGLVSSLATMTMRGATYQSDTMISTAAPLAECASQGELALKVARETGQRAAEAYTQIMLAFCRGSAGEYDRALAAGQAGLEVAHSIEHVQWTAAAHCALGAIHLDLLALPEAQSHLEQALNLANEIGSLCWVRRASGFLADTYLSGHESGRAESVLLAALPPDIPHQTCGQRLAWCARAELALAGGDPELVLQILEQVGASDGPNSSVRTSLRLAKLQGEALAALHRPLEAEAALNAAVDVAITQGARPLLWRVKLALGKLYRAQRRREEAEQAFSTARAIVDDLAAGLSDDLLRNNFLLHARAILPAQRMMSERQASREAFGGLTSREQDVATRIAQGKSNRRIADDLVIGERTVETHVASILTKLGFDSRTQIAAWIAERGVGSLTGRPAAARP